MWVFFFFFLLVASPVPFTHRSAAQLGWSEIWAEAVCEMSDMGRFLQHPPSTRNTQGWCPCCKKHPRLRGWVCWVSASAQTGGKKHLGKLAGQGNLWMLCTVKVSKVMAFTLEIFGTQDVGLVSALMAV